MTIKQLISLVIAGIVITGCAGPTVLDQNWGRSVKSAQSNQTLNPRAGENLGPVEGLDGRSSENNMDKYRRSFQTKEESSGYNIKLTGIGMRK